MYNWLNGEYATIFDPLHPVYEMHERAEKSIERFEYLGSMDDFEWLIENDFLTENDSYIKRKIAESHEKTRSKDYLHLIVLPVDQACNFSCVYCYEDHQQKSRMGDTHVQALHQLILQAAPKHLRLDYFGGEPLLNHKFILKLNQKIKLLTERLGANFISGITTNGSLLNESLARNLYDAGMYSYQITVDGLPEDHNKLRIGNNGKQTFESVWNGLATLVKLKDLEHLDVIVRVNFNQYSAKADKRKAFIEKLKDLIGDDERFAVLPRQIGDYSGLNGTPNPDANYLCSAKTGGALKEAYEYEIIEAGLRLSDISTWTHNGGSSCYAGRPNSFVVFPDMTLQKCTVAINNPLNTVGQLKDDGTFQLNDNWRLWTQSTLFGKDECNSCHFSSQCNSSACPLINIQNNHPTCPPDKFGTEDKVEKIIFHREA